MGNDTLDALKRTIGLDKDQHRPAVRRGRGPILLIHIRSGMSLCKKSWPLSLKIGP